MSEQQMTPAEIEREMAINAARKSARLMLTEEGHEVVCIEPQLWEAVLTDNARAIQPMFGDVPAVTDVVQLAKQAWGETGEGWTATAWFDSRAKSFERFAELLLAAAPTAGQAAAKGAAAVDKDSDGWTKWEGGECPVPDDTLVEVKFECGDSNRFLPASCWDWSHGDDTGYDIVSYRVLAAAPEVK